MHPTPAWFYSYQTSRRVWRHREFCSVEMLRLVARNLIGVGC